MHNSQHVARRLRVWADSPAMAGPLFAVLVIASVLLARPGVSPGQTTAPSDNDTRARYRIIIDNDFGGDPDGLFALAHHLLSPSVEVRGIIGSHHYPNGFYRYPGSPERACEMANALLAAMDLAGKVAVYQGGRDRIGEAGAPIESEAARFIVREAMREDARMPLYVACGAGLTDLASACLMEPRIASRIRLVWIGGHEHEGTAVPPPGGSRIEYNLGIDPKAAQVIFNQSEIPIWQVPRDAYRQALVSYAELRVRMKEDGKLPTFLLGRLRELITRANRNLGETYVLGDSPLVLLTALQSGWEPDPSSSKYISMPTPRITDQGLYENNPQGRPMRVYTQLDTRVMFEDFYAKVALFERGGQTKR
jgi:purine nucleosidase